MADELEPVTQQFIADLGDYLEPIEDASDETEGFADVVEQASENLSSLRDKAGDTGGTLGELAGATSDTDASLVGMAGSADDADVSTEALAESVGSLRDKVYEMYPGIDEAAASLLAEAAAAEAAGVANDEYAASLGVASAAGDGLHATLASIKDILGAAGIGESLTVGVYGLNKFFIDAEDGADDAGKAFTGLRTDASLLDDAMLSAANKTRDFWEAVNALNPELGNSENIFSDAKSALKDLGATENEAAAGAQALMQAQSQLDSLGGSGGGFVANALGALAENWELVVAGVAVGAPIIAGLLTEAGAVVTGFSAAITGIVPAVALAIPAVESLTHAFGDNRKELEKQPAAVREIVKDFRGLESEYKSMAKAFEPDVFGVVSRGLKAAKELLPTFRPLADQAAGGIDNLLDQVDKFFKASHNEKFGSVLGEHNPFEQVASHEAPTGFQKWLSEIEPMIKPAEEAIGGFIGTVVTDWGKFMTHFSGQDIKNAFHVLDVAVNVWSDTFGYVIGGVMRRWDELSAGFKNARNWYHDAEKATGEFALWVGPRLIELKVTVEKDFDEIRHGIAARWDEIIHDGETDLDRLRHDVAHGFDLVRHEALAAVDALPGELLHLGEDAVHGLADGIRDAAGDVTSAVHWLASLVPSGLSDILHFGSPSRLMREYGQDTVDGYIAGLRDREGSIRETMHQLAGTTAAGLAPAAAGSGSGSASSVHVTVPLTLTPGTQGFNDPAFLQYLQREVQEAVLRYQTLNPGNGLTRIVPGVRT